MSVIQTMLQNLDARGASAAPPVPGRHAAAPRTTAAARWRLPAILGLGVVAISGTAFGDWPGWLGLRKTPAAISLPAPAPIAAAPVVAATPASAALPPAEARSPVRPVAAAPATATAQRRVNPTPGAEPTKATAASPAAPLALRADTGLLPPLPTQIERRASSGPAESRATATYRQAVAAAQAGQRQAALQGAHEAIAQDKRHTLARQLAAVLEHELGDTDRAIQLAREGLALDARQSTLALLWARLLVAQGNAEAALNVLSEHAVAGAEADGLRGGVWAQQGEFKQSLIAYESALRHQPGNPIWWLGLGVALESDGQAQRARQAYGRAHSLGLPRDDLSGFVEQRLRALP